MIILSPAKDMSKEPIPSSSIPKFQKEAESLQADIKGKETYESLSLYHGLAFRYLKEEEFSKEEMEYCNQNLVILSALYGILSPRDGIVRYRLDFTKKGMYAFWEDKIYLALKERLQKGEEIINLASEEFSKTITRYLTAEDKFVNIDFLEEKDGVLKKHSTISKKGRGLMARYLIQQQSQEREVIQKFSLGGFSYSKEQSSRDCLIFIKK